MFRNLFTFFQQPPTVLGDWPLQTATIHIYLSQSIQLSWKEGSFSSRIRSIFPMIGQISDLDKHPQLWTSNQWITYEPTEFWRQVVAKTTKVEVKNQTRLVLCSPVKDLLPTLDVESEVREGDGGGVRVAGQEVPRPLVIHLLPLFSLLPAPLALLVPGTSRDASIKCHRY